MRTYQDTISLRTGTHPQFDPSQLDQRFVQFYNSGERIRVVTEYENGDIWTRYGTVAMTSGWRPRFILMGRITDRGSSDLLGTDDRIVAVKRHGRYHTLNKPL